MKGILCALVVLLIIALICDLKTDKVPNILILSGYGIGIAACVLRYGAIGIIWGILLIAAVWLFCMPVYLLGGLGGGDCKLLAWIVLFFEPEQLLECYFFIFLCGGVIAFIKLITAKGRTFHFTVAAFFGVIIFLVKTLVFWGGGEI